MRDSNVANRLYMTKRGRIVEATGFVKQETNDHYVEAKDVKTGQVEMYAKRHLRERGYAKRQHAFSSLAQFI